MDAKELVNKWFEKWESGDFYDLPISEDFKHTSPFGTIKGKKQYIGLVEQNKEKFLGNHFEIHDLLFSNDKACVRYTARQGETFSLDVSEWYYIKDNLIHEIIAYYHIGEVREERKLSNLQ